MSDNKRVLVVATSAHTCGTLPRKTGYWLGEVAHFIYPMLAAGHAVEFVTPLGGTPPLDAKSDLKWDRSAQKFRKDSALWNRFNHSKTPDQVKAEDYDAIYYAGGHGAMVDLPYHPQLVDLAANLYKAGKPVAAVCHGVAALLEIKTPEGKPLVAGRKVTGFTNTEEKLVGLTNAVPYLLEDELVKRGAIMDKGLPFLPRAIIDGHLITGQNPGSTKAVAKKLLAFWKS